MLVSTKHGGQDHREGALNAEKYHGSSFGKPSDQHRSTTSTRLVERSRLDRSLTGWRYPEHADSSQFPKPAIPLRQLARTDERDGTQSAL
jgi:hypothetical protein